MLYSYKGNYPTQLPNRIRLSDGSTRTDKTTFTDEEIADAGYVAVDDMPACSNINEKVEWNTVKKKWDAVLLNEQELADNLEKRWVEARQERDSLLKESDIQVLLAVELNEPVSQELRNYRQELRDIPQKYSDPKDIAWPSVNTEHLLLDPADL